MLSSPLNDLVALDVDTLKQQQPNMYENMKVNDEYLPKLWVFAPPPISKNDIFSPRYSENSLSPFFPSLHPYIRAFHFLITKFVGNIMVSVW